jgi:hypothetical protein
MYELRAFILKRGATKLSIANPAPIKITILSGRVSPPEGHDYPHSFLINP